MPKLIILIRMIKIRVYLKTNIPDNELEKYIYYLSRINKFLKGVICFLLKCSSYVINQTAF